MERLPREQWPPYHFLTTVLLFCVVSSELVFLCLFSAPRPVPTQRVVYVTTNLGVYALQASDGTPIWHYQVANKTSASVSGYRVLPGDGQVYVMVNGDLHVLRASDGSVLWQYSAASHGALFMDLVSVVHGTLYAWADSPSHELFLYALRASTGSVLWHSPVPVSGKVISAPVVINAGILVGSIDFSDHRYHASLQAFRARDGSLLWHWRVDHPFPGWVMSELPSALMPVVVNNIVYVAIPSDSSAPRGASLYALRAEDGTVLWHYKTGPQEYGVGMGGTIAVSEGKVYLITGADGETSRVSALRAADGSLLWKYRMQGGFDLRAAKGMVYVIGQGSAVISGISVHALRAEDGSQLWHDTRRFSAPFGSVGNGAVYLITSLQQGYYPSVCALQDVTGKQRWCSPLSSLAPPNLVLDDQVLYVTFLRSSFSSAGARGPL